ncbi:hypothetical protein MJO28_000938 [Puccinia striiformis f. sp. tritici]|uniref:Uncharacterized protein n=1 Tax=Puccinia striiformis f. sp. tritici TaxID=168172 RepID=A0ACC0F0G1_9BASI|nr:hypothetical protein MJO28_000938 [Puccinia striiformis f. sp. tritici]
MPRIYAAEVMNSSDDGDDKAGCPGALQRDPREEVPTKPLSNSSERKEEDDRLIKILEHLSNKL